MPGEENQHVCNACAVFNTLVFPDIQLPHQSYSLVLTKSHHFSSPPSPLYLQVPSSLTGWPLTGLPDPVIGLLDPLSTEQPGQALKNINQIVSVKLQTFPLSQLTTCSCHMQFSKKASGRVVGFFSLWWLKNISLGRGFWFAFTLLIWKPKQKSCFFKHYKCIAVCVLIDV